MSMRGSTPTTIIELPPDPGFFRAAEYGVIGDSATDNTDTLLYLISLAETFYTTNGYATIYFKAGDYLTDTLNFTKPGIVVRGKNNSNTNIINKGVIDKENPCIMREIAIHDFMFTDGYLANKSIRFDNVKFASTDRMQGVQYLHLWGYYTKPTGIGYYKCNFVYDSLYMAAYAYNKGVSKFIVSQCTFSGNYINHPIRGDIFDTAVITGNNINGGITGIFFGGQRVRALSNISVTNNTVYNTSEEGISFDGFGNNTALCPVIGQGHIVSAANNGGGKLVIEVSLSEKTGTHPNDVLDTLLLSERTDWTNFYFCFDTLSGQEGKYYKITAYDTTTNKLTLDTTLSAASVTVGGYCSVDGGFFNATVSGNTIHDCGTVGIAAYLNVFNFDIHDNTIYDCPSGMDIDGGLMLSLYRTKAWRINVHDNTVSDCPTFGVRFTTLYATDVYGYDNIFKDNTLHGASFLNDNQVRFTNSGNTITP